MFVPSAGGDTGVTYVGWKPTPRALGGLDGLDEVAEFEGVFDAGLVGDFDAGGDVDGVGLGDADGVGDVVGGEAAGEDEGGKAVEFAGGAGFGDPVPVEGLAGAAEVGGGGGVEDYSGYSGPIELIWNG